MKLLRELLGWIMPVVILGGAIWAFMAMGSQPPPARRSADRPPAPAVETAVAEPEQGGIDVVADGVVVPLREVTLAAEVPGRILEKTSACKAGRFVKAGTVLFRIDPRDYELDVQRLDRELAQAGLMIEEVDEELVQNATSTELAQRQVELARREVKRLDGLKAGKIVTEAEHERAVRDELTATNVVTTLQGQRRVLAKRRNRLLEAQSLASTMLERARLDLERTTVKAPADGVVVQDTVEQDSYVAKGTPLVTLEDTAAAEVRTSLQMEEVARIWGGRESEGAAPPAERSRSAYEVPDTPATVVFRLGDRRYEWTGTLSRQEGRGLDEKTRTLPFRVLVKDPADVRSIDRYGAVMAELPAEAPRSLLRGMFVEVRVHVESTHKLVSIPDDARRPNGEVWVVRDGRLVVLSPKPLDSRGGRTVYESLASGLRSGDRVVTSQLSTVRDGMDVTELGRGDRQSVKTAAADAGDAPVSTTP